MDHSFELFQKRNDINFLINKAIGDNLLNVNMNFEEKELVDVNPDEKELMKKMELLNVAQGNEKTAQASSMSSMRFNQPDIKPETHVESGPGLPPRLSSNDKRSFHPLLVDSLNSTVDDPLSRTVDPLSRTVDPLSRTVDDPLSLTVGGPLNLAREPERRNIAKVDSTVRVKEMSHEIASDVSDDDLGDMTYLDPEPVPDSDED